MGRLGTGPVGTVQLCGFLVQLLVECDGSRLVGMCRRILANCPTLGEVVINSEAKSSNTWENACYEGRAPFNLRGMQQYKLRQTKPSINLVYRQLAGHHAQQQDQTGSCQIRMTVRKTSKARVLHHGQTPVTYAWGAPAFLQ